MKESLVPSLFGGKIEVEKQGNNASQSMSQPNQVEEEKKDTYQKEIKFDLGFKYNDVVCGSSQTLALIDQSPYLLYWGNGDPVAKTYSEAFSFDRPIIYDCGGKNAVILTEKGSLYKINLETNSIDRISSNSTQVAMS